jgi:D-amino-acid oxidase
LRERVVVVGGGVIGLTSALVLAESGDYDVEVVAEHFGLASLSRVPAASFYPFAVEHPNVREWLRLGLERFVALSSDPATGVVIREGVELDPRMVAGCSPTEFLLPSGAKGESGTGNIARFRLPIIDIPTYLPWLQRRLESRGARCSRRRLRSASELDAATIVVNCTGSAARFFAADRELMPTLGQLVRMEACGIDRFALDERDAERPTYVVPRGHDVVIGSFDLAYDVDRLGLEPPAPDAERTSDIVARATVLEPRLADSRVLESYCGFRPRRRHVRVEIDQTARLSGLRHIHAYGHGGGGVTLSWGTANEVHGLVRSLT